MHGLIVGMTGSGKTTLAKRIARKARLNNRLVLVLDANLDPQWKINGADYVTNNPAEFLRLAHMNTNCTLIVDEAAKFCHRTAGDDIFWLATRARHKGHQSVFVTQYIKSVSLDIRGNCETLFCFNVAPPVAQIVYEEFGKKELLETPNFMKGEFLLTPRYGKPQKYNIFQNNA